MRHRTRIPLLVCVFALALVGCGSSDKGTIPPNDANTLLDNLAAVQSDIASGDCLLAEGHAQEVVDAVNGLPSSVDPKVAGELTKAATHLKELAADPTQCATGATGETTVPTTSSTSTTESVPPTTSTTTTPTEPDTSTTDESAGGSQNQAGGQDLTPPTGNQDQPSGGAGEPPSGGVGAGGSAG
jgi:hypothetical protein